MTLQPVIDQSGVDVNDEKDVNDLEGRDPSVGTRRQKPFLSLQHL